MVIGNSHVPHKTQGILEDPLYNRSIQERQLCCFEGAGVGVKLFLELVLFHVGTQGTQAMVQSIGQDIPAQEKQNIQESGLEM